MVGGEIRGSQTTRALKIIKRTHRRGRRRCPVGGGGGGGTGCQDKRRQTTK